MHDPTQPGPGRLNIDLRDLGRPLKAQPAGEQPSRALTYAQPGRDLTPQDDLEAAQGGQQAPTIVTLRHSHHRVAQLVACGYDPVHVAQVTGYDPVRIRTLMADPAFQELQAHYAAMDGADLQRHMRDKLGDLGVDALSVLQHRIDTEAGQFTNGQLMDLVKMCADRSDAPAKGGPDAPATAINIQVLNEIKEEVAAKATGAVRSREDITISNNV